MECVAEGVGVVNSCWQNPGPILLVWLVSSWRRSGKWAKVRREDKDITLIERGPLWATADWELAGNKPGTEVGVKGGDTEEQPKENTLEETEAGDESTSNLLRLQELTDPVYVFFSSKRDDVFTKTHMMRPCCSDFM